MILITITSFMGNLIKVTHITPKEELICCCFIFSSQKLLCNIQYKYRHSGCTIPPIPGRVAQSVTYLATDACLTADPGVASSIPARSHTFVEIDHEIISTVILLPSADSFKKGCCQLQAKECAQITG